MPQTSVIANMARAFAGMNADSSDSADNYLSRLSGETTLQIPFGRAVLQSSASDDLALSCTSASAANMRRLLGILAYNPFNQITSQLGNVADANGNIGLVAKAPLRIKYRGSLWVAITENVSPDLGVRISIDATGGGIGTFRASASAGHSISIGSFAKWTGTHLAATGYGLLSFDFRMVGLATAD